MFLHNVAQFSSPSSSQLTMTQHILIIDSQVDDYQQLVSGAKPEFEVFVLDAHHDGIEQITEILYALRLTPDASLSLHIVSHGSPGCIYLGNSQLSLDTLESYTAQIQSWFPSQASELLIYGCNVAAGDAGAELLAKLYGFTGVAIAASTSRVGHARRGGSWNLDVAVGTLEPFIALSENTQQTYINTFNSAPTIASSILFVDDDRSLNGQGTWLQVLNDLGYINVTYEEIPADGNPTNALGDFDGVIWSNGDQAYTNLTAENVSALTAYLDAGGNLLYAGGHNLYSEPNVSNFAPNYLGVASYTENMPYVTSYPNAVGIDGSYTLNDWSGGFYGGTMISAFAATSSTIFMELSGWNAEANEIAVVKNTEIFNTATWGFDINQLGIAYRKTFLATTLNAMDLNANSVVTSTTSEDADGFTVDLLDGAFDADGDALNVTNLTLIGGDISGVTLNGNSLDVDPSAYNYLAEGESEVITYSYTISDGNGGTVAQTATITINGVNDAPTVSATVTDSATEDEAAFTVDLLAGASDVDTSDTLSVSNLTLDSGDDSGVTLNGNSLDIDPSAYDFLAEGESEVITYSYDISDGNEGGTVAQTATITINGVNDAPTVSATVTDSATEDDDAFTVDFLAGASDVDTSDTLSVSGLTLDSGNDAGVTINGNSLDIDPSAYSYLAEGESEVITYSYTISDGNGGTVAQTATITINGVNDAPTVSTAVTSTATEDDATFSIDLLAGASDVDTSDILNVSNLSLDSGDDSGVIIDGNSLDIDPNAYDYLAEGESEVITYSYNISDGNEGGTVSQTATITINGVNDVPEITSSDTASIDENSTTVTTVVATDVDGDSITYSITGGADAALFGVNETTGELSFITAPDAEAPLDDDGDNVYQVEVTANDGNEGTAVQTLTVLVGNVDDNAPVFTSSANPTMAENSTVATTVVATDADGDSVTYAIAGGVDADLFEIDSTTGELSFITAPNFEMATDENADNVYEVTVSASDGSEGTTQNVSVSVVDLSNGVTDFNNDNQPDVVWRRPSTGQTNIWFTDGENKIGGGPAGATIANPNWLTVGVGDFDKDGKRDDILWRNVSSGANVIWFMDGINKVGNAELDSIGINWEVQGVGDFDHQDYTDDILWRNQSTGQTVVWTMDGTNKTGNISFGTLGTAWKAQGVGDFEANNFVDDIVWRNYTTGQTIVWETDGQEKTDSFALDTIGTNWKIDGVGDLDGDGVVDDLLWYNTSNNNVVTWFIDDGVKFANSTIGAPSNGWDAVL